MSKSSWQTLHESVIVGYFCQAVGWLSGARSTAKQGSSLKDRVMEAINLSHNPFDPAVGDLLLQLKQTDEFPQTYFVFEMKVKWHEGVEQERMKFRKKTAQEKDSPPPPFDEDRARRVAAFPKAMTAHLYGATSRMEDDKSNRTWLWIAPYWSVLLDEKQKNEQRVLEALANIVEGNTHGFTINELDAYIKLLNEEAVGGTKAAEGPGRLIFAIRNYEQYLLTEHQMERVFHRYWELQELEQAAEAKRQRDAARATRHTGMRGPG